MAPRAHSEKEELLLHTSLFIFESSLVVMAMAMYIKGERPFSVFLSSGTGTAFLCAIATFFIAGSVSKGMITMAITSIGLAILIAWQAIPSTGWLEGILWGLLFGGMVWVIFFGNLWITRKLRK